LLFQAAKKSIGMPLTVQIIGLPFQEEKVLRCLNQLEEIRNSKE